jgi:CheY-like chemotaxis protein
MEKRVLIVEDDSSLKPILTRMVERIEPLSTVDWVTSGEEAIRVLRRGLLHGNQRTYDLIISDVSLDGHRSGVDLVHACHQAEIPTPVILTSSRWIVDPSVPFLPKPITFDAFEKCARPLLAPHSRFTRFGKRFRERLLEYLLSMLLLGVLLGSMLLSYSRLS